MSIIIKKIELKNWFGYKGEYEENSFEFSDGVNIIVASNDVGKSKLHNAFRWLLTDKVIIKDALNKYNILSIDLNTINEILNHHIQLTLKNEETTTIGVRLNFEEIKRGEKFNRILTKELTCKKDVNSFIVSAPITKVQKEERGNIKTAPESFSDMIKKIIRPNLLNFFLVQGEALEDLTPLRGESLRNTINLLVNLNTLERKCDLSIRASRALTNLRQDIETKENRTNLQALENVSKKNELENKINKINNDDLIELQNFIDETEQIEIEFSSQAALIEIRQALKDKIDDFNRRINIKQGELKSNYSNFVSNYINKDFWLSKITNNVDEKNNLLDFNNAVSDFSAIRRAELDDKLSMLEQKMLFALERDQPRPEILEQMLVDNICYVCSSELNGSNINYMREKLIPYFKKELNHDDEELNKYDEVSEIFKKFSGYLNKYSIYDNAFFQYKIDDIILLEKASTDIEQELQDLISENGLVEIDDNEKINLITYNQALKDKTSYLLRKEALLKDLASCKEELKKIINLSVSNTKSSKLRKAEGLEKFGKAVNHVLIDVKRNAYESFSNDLQTITNIKWKAFSKDNKGLNSQSIKVDFKLNNLNQPDFEIKVIDKFGNNSGQGGGASQALRQLSVIFGLIEKAGGNVDYPFIADAPTSNMTSTLSEHFYTFQLQNSSTQNILMTKELWNDKEENLNEQGKNILNKVGEISNAKLFTIVNGTKYNKIITEI